MGGTNLYGSHLPVLQAIARWRPIYRVVEFGMGDTSTGTFLNKEVYGNLQNLLCFEVNAEYAKLTEPARQAVVTCSEEYAAHIVQKLGPFDLAFVDGASAEWRAPTAIACRGVAALVVMHDAERYGKTAAVHFQHAYWYKDKSPHTVVFSDKPLGGLKA